MITPTSKSINSNNNRPLNQKVDWESIDKMATQQPNAPQEPDEGTEDSSIQEGSEGSAEEEELPAKRTHP